MSIKAWNIVTAVLAVIAIAPWVIYLGGLAKLTEVITGGNYSQAWEQTLIMLEWYTVSAQIVNLVLIVIACIVRGGIRRTHSMFLMFLAVNSALIIVRATVRITEINIIDDGLQTPGNVIAPGAGLNANKDDTLKYLRAIACGQVASATFNFVLAIVLGLGGTAAEVDQHEAKAQQPVSA